MSANSFVGSPVERVEDLRLLRGRGQFVDDVARPGQLHAVILRSPVAHGRIRNIDVGAALSAPGVHAVITARDLGSPVPTIPLRLQPLPELDVFRQPVIAETKLRYVGEPVAVVLAESAAEAEDALELIELDIESLPAVADREAARRGDALLFEQHGSNLAITYTAERGDADAAFRDADYTRRERFEVHRHAAVPMEPRGLLAEWDPAGAKLTVTGAAKVPFANRRILAGQMGLSEDAVELVEIDVGGGFGARGEFYPEDFLIPYAARLTGRPVKWTEDRREHLMTSNHARDVACEVEVACRKDGTILALRGWAVSNIGAYIRTNGSVGPRNVAQFLSGCYRIPNIRIESSLVVSNNTPSGTYRGPGRYEADFARERLFDLAAGDLGIDRVEFRRRNLVPESEIPWALATITPYESRTELDSGAYEITLDRCLTEFGWSEKSKLDGRLIDGRYHGVAVGCFIEGGAAGPKEQARLVIEPDGTVSVYVGSSAIGQGLETVMAQIAADALELPMDRIRVFHGSTGYVREGYGSFHSRSVVMGGSAILAAAAMLRDEIRREAAERLGCGPGDIEIGDGAVSARGGASIPFTDLAGLSAEGEFNNKKYSYAYGAHAAHVAVDPKTGHVDVLDYVAVEDVGRMINPLTVHGQVVGAIVQGLGGTFLEHLVYDAHGQFLTGSFADYLLPSATDFPNIRAVSLQLRPSPINPLGAKGAGEGGIIPVGGVIANALASALSSLGVAPHALPLSPPRVWQLIRDARQAHAPASATA